MRKTLITAALYIAANAIGLLLASLLIQGFSIDILSFFVVVLVFSLILVTARPLVSKLSETKVPALQGGVALITTFVGLFLTDLLLPGLDVGGLANLLIATFLVWVGTVTASLVLPGLLGGKEPTPK